ncbi:hypothetical protein [Curtobacterium sp. NPDC089689]|uniref:hypothetical protein n=1 Tax=Curtobacterium sp. NPDC089689 TaxID=3363968 RepID=UPI0037F12CB4
MASRRRVSLIGGLVVLLAVAAVISIAVVQRGAPDERSIGAATTTLTEASPPGTTTEPGGSGGALSPSNALGAPVAPAQDPSEDASPSDAAVEPWWRRVPPVAGTLTAPDGSPVGKVTVLVTDGDTLTVTIVGARRLPEAATSAVLTSTRGGEEVLGAVSPDMRGVGFVLGAADADRLPDPVRALELRGKGGAVVASAVLLPV